MERAVASAEVRALSTFSRGELLFCLANRSHEALLLEFEEALTRASDVGGPSLSAAPTRPGTPTSSGTLPARKFYNTSSHFIWIGDRTRQLNGAHVEYFRGIANPM